MHTPRTIMLILMKINWEASTSVCKTKWALKVHFHFSKLLINNFIIFWIQFSNETGYQASILAICGFFKDWIIIWVLVTAQMKNIIRLNETSVLQCTIMETTQNFSLKKREQNFMHYFIWQSITYLLSAKDFFQWRKRKVSQVIQHCPSD